MGTIKQNNTKSKKNYSIIIVSGATSTNKEFVISSKLIKNSITAFSVLLLIFGFVIFDYLTISFNKERMERLEMETLEKDKTIAQLSHNYQTLAKSLERMEEFKQRIMVAAGLQSPDALTKVGSGGYGPGTTVPVPTGSIEVQPSTELPRQQITNQIILDKTKQITGQAKDVEKVLKYVELHIHEQKAKLASTPALWPTRGYITDGYHNRTHPITGKRHFHAALDIATQLGNKVIATADGFVLFTEKNPAMGNLIHIDHGFGFATRYGHLASFNVKEGDRVKRGQVIGYVGNTGRSTAPHLHYEVIYMNKAQNPMNYIID